MADNETADALETKAEAMPGTGEPQPTTDKTGTHNDADDLADKVSMWQAMSRENEKKMHANMKRATEAESKLADSQHQLAEANARIARLQAQAAYPQLTDDVFDSMYKGGDDPAEIAEWAKSAAKHIPLQAPAETDGPAPTDTDTRKAVPASVKEAYSHSAPHPTGPVKGSVESGYEYGRKYAAISNDK